MIDGLCGVYEARMPTAFHSVAELVATAWMAATDMASTRDWFEWPVGAERRAKRRIPTSLLRGDISETLGARGGCSIPALRADDVSAPPGFGRPPAFASYTAEGAG